MLDGRGQSCFHDTRLCSNYMEKTQVTRKPRGQEAGGILVPALGEVLGRYCVNAGFLAPGSNAAEWALPKTSHRLTVIYAMEARWYRDGPVRGGAGHRTHTARRNEQFLGRTTQKHPLFLLYQPRRPYWSFLIQCNLNISCFREGKPISLPLPFFLC